MSKHYQHRLRQLQSLLEPGLRRMLLLSFVLHLIVPLILSGVIKISHKTPQLPVYRVNLVNKPVKDPRTGRPDATPAQKKKPVKKQPAKTIAVKKKTVPKKPPIEKAVPVKQIPDAKTLAEKAAQEKAALKERLDEMARKRKMEELRAAIATQQKDLGKPVDALVGEPDGKGDEIGISTIRYIEGFIKEQWRLSPYQLPNPDLQAEIRVIYSSAGKMRNWEFVEKSGNTLFDDSLRRAILKSRDLGQTLPVAGNFEIIFNLKDLQN